MSRYQKRSLLPALAAGAGLLMACVIYAEIRARPVIEDGTSAPMAQTRTRPSLSAGRAAMPAKTRYAAIVERPVFSPTRRPPSEAAIEATAPTLDFSLFGVVNSAGEQSALIKPSAGGEPVRVKEGDDFSGWTVARIASDRILVRHDAMERELLLDFAAPAPPVTETAMPMDAQTSGQPNAQNNGQQTQQDSEPVPPPEAEEPAPADKIGTN